MDRIQINGVWYVRETQEQEIILDDLTKTLNIIYENENYSWEATRIYKDDGETFYDTFDIEFTDKRVKPWKTDLWDNNAWMRGILINDPVSLEHLRESVCPQGEAELKAFLTKLKEEEWL